MKHYSLLHDMPTHYILHDSRDKRVFEIAKHGLDEDTHEQLRNLPPMKQFKGYDNDEPSNKDIPGTDSMPVKEQPQKKTNPGNTETFPKTVDQRAPEEQPQHYSSGGILTSEHRNNLSDKSFAVPSERKYPINDINHARNALSRASQHASPSQQSQIKAAVHKKFPSIQQASNGGKIHDNKNLEQLKKDFAKFISEEEKENYAEGGEVNTKPSMEGTQLEALPEAPIDIYTPTPLPTPEEEHKRHIEVPEAHENGHAHGGAIKKASHFESGGKVPEGFNPEAAKTDMSKLIDAHHKLVDAHSVNLSAQDVDPNAALNIPPNEKYAPLPPPEPTPAPPTPEESAANLAAVVPGVQKISENPNQAVQAASPEVAGLQVQQQVQPVESAQQQAPPQTTPTQQSTPASSVQQPQQGAQTSNLDRLLAQSQEAYTHLIEQRRADDQRFGALVASKTIDPNRYFNNQSLGQKLYAGLAMGLASVGAAVSHMPNQAIQVMSDAINRDIDAQKNDQSNAINLWKMNHESLGDDMSATLQTRNQMLESAKVKLDELLGAAPGPMAAQKAAALKTQIQLEQEQNNVAITQAKMKQNYLKNMGSIGGTPSGQQQNSPENQILGKSVSGLITPEESKQALKEVGQAKLIESLRGDMQGSFDDLNSKFGAGILTPGDRKSAINAFSSRIQHIFVGRFNENSAKQEADAIMPQPFDDAQTRANRQQRFDELFDSGRQDQSTLNEMGIEIPKGRSKSSQYNSTAILTPTGQTKMVPTSQLNYYLQHGAKKVE